MEIIFRIQLSCSTRLASNGFKKKIYMWRTDKKNGTKSTLTETEKKKMNEVKKNHQFRIKSIVKIYIDWENLSNNRIQMRCIRILLFCLHFSFVKLIIMWITLKAQCACALTSSRPIVSRGEFISFGISTTVRYCSKAVTSDHIHRERKRHNSSTLKRKSINESQKVKCTMFTHITLCMCIHLKSMRILLVVVVVVGRCQCQSSSLRFSFILKCKRCA